tara:strand:+ start:363 stop:593 length:231 start_codon:yes stop_codon:yes gene_type:complete
MADRNGELTFKVLVDGTASLQRTGPGKNCSGCDNSCQRATRIDIVEEVKVRSKCCKKYKKKKSFCKRCPKRIKGVA